MGTRSGLKHIAPALLGLLLLPNVTHALSNEQGQYSILGAGTNSCGEWTKARAGDQDWNQLIITAWVLGYLTAVNEYAPGSDDITGNTDIEGLRAWLDNYCSQHSLEIIANAAQKLVKELRQRSP